MSNNRIYLQLTYIKEDLNSREFPTKRKINSINRNINKIYINRVFSLNRVVPVYWSVGTLLLPRSGCDVNVARRREGVVDLLQEHSEKLPRTVTHGDIMVAMA